MGLKRREETLKGYLFWLADEQAEQPRPFFAKNHDKPRIDDRGALSGFVFFNRNEALARCARMMKGLAAADAGPKAVMIAATSTFAGAGSP